MQPSATEADDDASARAQDLARTIAALVDGDEARAQIARFGEG